MPTWGYSVPGCPSLSLNLSSQLYKLNPSYGEKGIISEQTYAIKLKSELEAKSWEEVMPMLICL